MLRLPHGLSDGQLGLILAVILPVMGGLIRLYNAYRTGRLKRKPNGPANPRLVNLVILAGIILAVTLLAVVG